MALSYSDRQDYIMQISLNEFPIFWKDCFYLYSEPSQKLISKSKRIYDKAYKQGIELGFIPNEEFKNFLKQRGVWDDDKDLALKLMGEDIDKLRKELVRYKYRSGHKKQIENTIEILEKEIKKLYSIKDKYIDKSADYFAQLKKLRWLLFHCLTDESGNKVWDSYEDLLSDNDYDKINELMIFSQRLNVYDESIIRELSRTEPWRTKWRASCETGDSLFGKPTTLYTNSQYLLTHWSMTYDMVYKSMDCPSNDVINDDQLLDNWFIEQEQKHSEQKSNDVGISNPKISNAQEVFLKVDGPKDAQEVYNNLNSASAQAIRSSRSKAIAEKGKVKEAELPDVKQGIKMKMVQMGIDSAKSRAKG